MTHKGQKLFSYEFTYISRKSTSRLIQNYMRTVIRQYTYTISIRMCIGKEEKWLLTDLSASFLFDFFVVLQARSVISCMMLIKVVNHPALCLLSTKDRNSYLRKLERTQIRLLWLPDGHPLYRYQSGYLKTKLINYIKKNFFCDRSIGHEVLCLI